MYEKIYAIAARKINGQDPTTEEREQIINHVAETILMPGNGSVDLNTQIQSLFPDEYGKGIDIQEDRADDPEQQDKEPAARHYSAAGILEINNYLPEIKDNQLINEEALFTAIEEQTGTEAIPGDIITVTYINPGATKATVLTYIINANFMGSYDVDFYGKRTTGIY